MDISLISLMLTAIAQHPLSYDMLPSELDARSLHVCMS